MLSCQLLNSGNFTASFLPRSTFVVAGLLDGAAGTGAKLLSSPSLAIAQTLTKGSVGDLEAVQAFE